jgi:ABC-type transporter Mla subunit MlaD
MMFTASDACKLPGIDHDSKAEQILAEALRNFASQSEQLADAAYQVTQRSAAILSLLDDNRIVNPLGELQRSAVEVERLCATRAAASDEAKRTIHTLRTLNAITSERMIELLSSTPFECAR